MIYIHIPFCKSRCFYCDFHSGTNLNARQHLVNALCHEIQSRKNYLKNDAIKTIYMGGGTPSLLRREDFGQIFGSIKQTFDISQCEEITIEANPDDLTDKYISMLLEMGFNRISIGIQSFNNDELKLINRRHNTEKAIEAVLKCQTLGFKNISIDLMYGLPGQSAGSWANTLQQALNLNVQHISAYHLTYEKGTELYRKLQIKEINEMQEEDSISMFKMLIDTLETNGFEQYEISNFSLPGFRSKHNSSYWNDKEYLGVGTSAHSYNLQSRQWNIADTEKYIKGIENANPIFEMELLSPDEKYNDYIITRLRTKEGIDLPELKEKFGDEKYQYCLTNSNEWINKSFLQTNDNYLQLTKKGIFISDSIFSDLIWID